VTLEDSSAIIYSKFPFSLGTFIHNLWHNSFHSLHYSMSNQSRSLFVHVPPFEAIPPETQMNFIRELLNSISSAEFDEPLHKFKKNPTH
jgi:hypothetical protein